MSHSANGERLDRLPAYPLRVERIEPGQLWIARTLSNDYGGLFTHYGRGGSVYCDLQTCPPAVHKSRRIWKGYAAVELYSQKKALWFPAVLEITEHCELDLRGLYARGQVWELQRPAKSGNKNPPVTARLLEERDPTTFPPVFDIRPCLLHLYHVEALNLGQANPLPPRTMVQATPAEESPEFARLASQPVKELVSDDERAKANRVWRELMDSRKNGKGVTNGKQGSS